MDSIGSFPPSGFAEGVFADFGEYDECLSVEIPDDRRFSKIKGKYCLSKLILPFPLIDWNERAEKVKGRTIDTNLGPFSVISEIDLLKLLNMVNGSIFQLGICIPSVCGPNEVQHMLNKSE